MPTTAIIAALPREIAGLVRGVRADPALTPQGIYLHRLPNAIVVAAGMGQARAALAVEAAFQAGDVTTLISAGLAGACTAAYPPGSIAEASQVIDVKTGERFATISGLGDCVLATTETIAGVHEKLRLAQTYSAALVDMEAATVARLAAARGLGFRAVKGISDAHDFELASLGRFSGRHGSFRVKAFALHTAVRPHRWAGTMRLGRNSNRALVALHARLLAVLQQPAPDERLS